MYLFFDTETTGLPKNWKAPVNHLNNWPRLVQLAYSLFDDQGNMLSSADFIIKPDGFSIPSKSSDVHGITTERALKEGVALVPVLKNFHQLIIKSNYLVAHNISFDEKVMGSELLRAGMINSLDSKPKICTMQSATDFCAISGPYGFKWPKLEELHQILFNMDFEEAHNASADIAATAKCFWELKRIGII
ncbi:MAG: 3'-5' exonuclease [Balneolales bacterium]